MTTALQRELNRRLERTARQYERINADLERYAIKTMSQTRLELLDLLEVYTDANDTINRNRMFSLLADIQRIEHLMYETQMQAMNDVIKTSGEHAIKGGAIALGSVAGGTAVAEISDEVFNRLSMEVVRYVINRSGDDGLLLSDRVWRLSQQQKLAIESVIRSGIIRGESVNTLVAKVRKVYANETWKIRRLVVTEGNVAYRTGSAYVAQQSNLVKGLRIHRGEANRPEHRCSELEKIDRYGLGKGVYLPTDHEVLNPHPNCTSFTTYELVENPMQAVNSMGGVRVVN